MRTSAVIPRGLEKFIQIQDEEIVIDWSGLGNLKKRVSQGCIDLETFNQTFDEALKYLLETERLTFKRKNVRRVVSLGSDFGPKTSYGQDRMNFSREKDARGYLESFHNTAQYSIAVERLS